MKQKLPVAVGAIAGILVILATYVKMPVLQTCSQQILRWQVVVSAFALGLGIANITRVHYDRVSKKQKYAGYSILLLVSMYLSVFIGFYYGSQSVQYKFIWNNIYSSLNATWYSATAFYMMSCAWRGFRVRSLQAAVLMITAIVVMLSKVGIGQVLWAQFPVIGNWLIAIPNAAAMRGIIIGSCLGAVGVSFRIILGLERGHLGGGGA